MATIVATVGATNANSFVTEARGEALIDELVGGEAWVDSGDFDLRARTLIQATIFLDALRWRGTAATATQALAFPRVGLTDPSGFAVDSSTIPLRIERATAQLALRLFGSNVSLESDASLSGLTRLKAESVELEWRDGEVNYKSLPEEVRALIPVGWLYDDDSPALLFEAMGV